MSSRQRFIGIQVILATALIILGYFQYTSWNDTDFYAQALRVSSILLQLICVLFAVIFGKVYFSDKSSWRNNPWRKILWEDFPELFKKQYEKNENSRPKWELALRAISGISYIGFTLLFFAVVLIIVSLSTGAHAFYLGSLRQYTLRHLDTFILSIICLFFMAIVFWRIKALQHENKKNRSAIVSNTVENVRKEGFPRYGEGYIRTPEHARIMVREILRDAIRLTEVGSHKLICRKTVSKFGHRLGPKTAWLYVPYGESFAVAELVAANNDTNYKGVCINYRPRKMNFRKWNNRLQELSNEIEDTRNNHKHESRKALNRIIKEKQQDAKVSMFRERFEFGSDVGFLYHFRSSEIGWFLGTSCNMHDPSYLRHIKVPRTSLFALRSALIVPIHDKDSEDSEPLGMLAIYSPAVGEVDSVDYAYITMYANMLSQVLRFIKMNFGSYPVMQVGGRVNP